MDGGSETITEAIMRNYFKNMPRDDEPFEVGDLVNMYYDDVADGTAKGKRYLRPASGHLYKTERITITSHEAQCLNDGVSFYRWD